MKDDDALALVALAQHLITTDRMAGAEPLLRRADATGEQKVRVEALTALASGLGGRSSRDALDQLERAVAAHPQEPDLPGVLVALYAAEGRNDDAVEATSRLIALPRIGAGTVLGAVYGAVAMAIRGDQDDAVRIAERFRPLAEDTVHSLPEGLMMQAWLEAAVPWTGAKVPIVACEIALRGHDRTLRAGLRPDRTRFAHLLAVGRLVRGDASVAVHLVRQADAAPCFWRDSRRPEIVASMVETLVLSGDQAEAAHALGRLEGLRCTPEQEPRRRLARAAVLMGCRDLASAADEATAVGDLLDARGDRTAGADAWTDALRYGGQRRRSG